MAGWWITEVVPIGATALLPLLIFPLSGSGTIEQASSPYGDPLIFLFLGGFVLALGMETSGLHRRVALITLKVVGGSPARIIGGFMVATGFLSMWMSNTSTTVLMLPIAVSLVEVLSARNRDRPEEVQTFAKALLIAIAFSASIGGVGTLIGTPPNTLLAGFLKRQYGISISFTAWMAFGVPIVLVFLPLGWIGLTRIIFPISKSKLAGGAEAVSAELKALGPLTSVETKVIAIFGIAASLWISRPLLVSHLPLLFSGLNDSSVAVLAAVLLFVLSSGRGKSGAIVDWSAASRIPWDVLLLFGGGLSLAAAMERNGVAELVGHSLIGLRHFSPALIVLIAVSLVILLSEVMSNTATAATFLPILASAATAIGIHPYLLLVPAVTAASWGFMLPAATPPNAIVYGSGYLKVRDLVRAGFLFDLLGALLTMILAYFALPVLLDLPVMAPP